MTTDSATSPTTSGLTTDAGTSSPPPFVPVVPAVPSSPAAPEPAGWLRSILTSFFVSKKFLVASAAGLVAIVRLIAVTVGVDVDQDALDRIFLALLAYVGAQGISDVGKGARQVDVEAAVAAFRDVLNELVRSKKFLAAAAAVLVAAAAPLVRKLGIELDADSLNRLFVALLAYVGVQGVADFGKGAAQVVAASKGRPPGIHGHPCSSPVTTS